MNKIGYFIIIILMILFKNSSNIKTLYCLVGLGYSGYCIVKDKKILKKDKINLTSIKDLEMSNKKLKEDIKIYLDRLETSRIDNIKLLEDKEKLDIKNNCLSVLPQKIKSLESTVEMLKSFEVKYIESNNQNINLKNNLNILQSELLEIDNKKQLLINKENELNLLRDNLTSLELKINIEEGRIDLAVRQERFETEKLINQIEYELKDKNKIIEDLTQLVNYSQNEILDLKKFLTFQDKEVNQTEQIILNLFNDKKIQVRIISNSIKDKKQIIELQPLSSFSQSLIKEVIDQLSGHLPIKNTPKYEVSNGKICIYFDENLESDKLSSNENWLLKAAKESCHFRLNGQTNSGKSTLANNLIECLKITLNCQDVVLIDPKYPLSKWHVDPGYKGIDESLKGLELIAETIESRVKLAIVDTENNQDIRKFKPVLFVIDEIDYIISNYGKEGTQLLKIGLKVGRALNVKICYLGQSPLCSDLGLRKNDFLNSTNMFLGENIKNGIDEVCYSESEKKELLGELQTRMRCNQPYLALIKLPSKKAFIAELPSINQYIFNNTSNTSNTSNINSQHISGNGLDALATQKTTLATLATSATKQGNKVFCVNCHSENVKKNGNYKNYQRHFCKDCEKTFINFSK